MSPLGHYFASGRGAKYIVMSKLIAYMLIVSVCLSVGPLIKLEHHTAELHEVI